MTPRRALALILAALACLAVAAGCGGDDDQRAASPRRSRRASSWTGSPNPDHAGVYGTIEEGFFEDEGIAVTAEVPSDPSAALKRLAAGRADFAISYEPEVLIARSQGVPVVAVDGAGHAPAELRDLSHRPDLGAGDLEGKTIGAAGAAVCPDRPLLDAVVRNGGGDPEGVTVKERRLQPERRPSPPGRWTR